MDSRDLRQRGLTFVSSVGDLLDRAEQGSWRDLPTLSGVYAVIWPRGRSPVFLSENSGHPCATVDAALLAGEWVSATDILYIGATERTLKERLRELGRHGAGLTDKHSGGEWMWQLEGIEDAWVVALADQDPIATEDSLLRVFRQEHGGRLPFANRLATT